MRTARVTWMLVALLAGVALALATTVFPTGAAGLGLLGPPTTGPAPPPSTGTGTSAATAPATAPSADPTAQRCFGAASADRRRPCENPALRLSVYPAPENARAAQRNRGCDRVQQTAVLRICFWGTPAARATRLAGLIGDSHASHWRAALETVMAARGWRAFTIQRAGCPLTLAHPDLPGADRRRSCMRWNRAVQAWIAAHPEVDTVFTSSHRSTVIPARGQTAETARQDGYTRALQGLLDRGVRHVVAIRDTPRIAGVTIPCIERAVAAGVAPGPACALPRRYALRPDPVVQAARRLDGRVQVANLAGLLCGPAATTCEPVIGGALVLRDVSHMTTTYSATLGPYLLGVVDRLSAAWGPARWAGG